MLLRWSSEGRIAQLVERTPEKREVTGSTPVPTTFSVLFLGRVPLAGCSQTLCLVSMFVSLQTRVLRGTKVPE